LFPIHAAGCRGNTPSSQNTSARALVSTALQVFTCITDSYQAFRACLQRHMKSCSNSSNLCRQLLFAFPSHRVATEKDQSSHCGNSGISAADSVHMNFIPALTSIPLQQLPWLIKVQETKQVQKPISTEIFLGKFYPTLTEG